MKNKKFGLHELDNILTMSQFKNLHTSLSTLMSIRNMYDDSWGTYNLHKSFLKARSYCKTGKPKNRVLNDINIAIGLIQEEILNNEKKITSLCTIRDIIKNKIIDDRKMDK